MIDDELLAGTIEYRDDHVGLLVEAEDPPESVQPLQLGGIVVPIARDLRASLPGLALATTLAAAHGAVLFLILSKDARKQHLPASIRAKLGDRLVVVDLEEERAGGHWRRWLHGIKSLRTSSHPLSTYFRANDVGQKRNLGLAVAALMKWETVLLLDDDVAELPGGRTLDIEGSRRALRLLAEDTTRKVVGWTLEDFPDNSMFGHARRIAGHQQGIFTGGGALLVRVDEDTPFFPDVYNEDWLFLIAIAWSSGNPWAALVRGGRMRQLLYNPFKERRARSEEAGEILGECLMNQLEVSPWPPPARSTAYWRKGIAARHRALLRLVKVLENRPRLKMRFYNRILPERLLRSRVVACLQAAADVNLTLEPTWLASYVETWLVDLGVWRAYLREVLALDLGDVRTDDPLLSQLKRLSRSDAPAPVSV